MQALETNDDTAAALALQALAWTLGDPGRAERLLALTGLTPDDLRSRALDRSLQAAVLGFLEAHQPDLLDCADALGVSPERVVAAHARLEL